MSSDYRICLDYHGLSRHIDLHETSLGEIKIDGRKYSIASDDKELFTALLPHIQGLRGIADIAERASLLGRVEKVLSGGEALSARLDSYCQSLVQAGFTGSVLVERDGKVLLNAAYGVVANKDARRLFYIASLSKQFTAAAIMQLVDKGVIDLEESINVYLPLTLQSDRWKDVTVHHLLSHQSGIHNYTDPIDVFEKRCVSMTVDSILQEEKGKELEFPSGSQFNYSNTNYELLGKIIAHISGISYSQYIRENLLAPAGMNSSRVQLEDEKSPDKGTVKGHTFRSDATLKEVVAPDLHLIYASGGVISTAEDLGKWSHVLDGEAGILSKDSIKRMTTPNRDNYGYGLAMPDDAGRRVICHGGGFVGFSTEFRKYPDEKAAIIVLSNNEGFQAASAAGGLEEIVFDGKMNVVEPVPLTTQDFSDYQGFYQSQNFGGKTFHFEVAESGALQEFSDDSPTRISPIFPLSNGRVFMPQSGVEFERQESGEILVYGYGKSESFDTLVPITQKNNKT